MQTTGTNTSAMNMGGWNTKLYTDFFKRHKFPDVYDIKGISASKFFEKRNSAEFDIAKLQNDIAKHFDDFDEELKPDVLPYAYQFCSLIVFKVEPETHGEFRKASYIFIMAPTEGTEPQDLQTKKYSVDVLCHNDFVNVSSEYYMIISLKQAVLLSMLYFTRLIPIFIKMGIKLMAPLSCVCYSKDIISDLARELGEEEHVVLITIAQSTYNGGQNLPLSDASCAVVVAMSITRNITNENIKKFIIVNKLKQYIARNKLPNKDKIKIYSKYATGVPLEFDYKYLLNTFDKNQRFSYEDLKVVEEQTRFQVKIN